MNGPGNGQVPAAFRRVGVPQGASVTIRSRRNAPRPMLTVEDAAGNDVLEISSSQKPGGCCSATPAAPNPTSGSAPTTRQNRIHPRREHIHHPHHAHNPPDDLTRQTTQ